MMRLSPFVLWGTLFSLQSLIFLSRKGYSSRDTYFHVFRFIAITIFPILIITIVLINTIDDKYYRHINKEDQLVEWLTFGSLFLGGILAIYKAFRLQQIKSRYFYFFLLFGIACIILAFEEISWGQRIFSIESSDFFLENSDQQEINIHNVVNQWLGVRTKHISAIILFFYGVCLPLLNLIKKFSSFLEKTRVIIPPIYLTIGFSLGAFLTIDIFSGLEEEIAELFLSLSLLMFVIHEYLSNSS
jgi:hypothetical protein